MRDSFPSRFVLEGAAIGIYRDHPGLATAKNVALLSAALSGNLGRRENLDQLADLIRKLAVNVDLAPDNQPVVAAIFSELTRLLRRALKIQELDLRPGISVRVSEGSNCYVVKGITEKQYLRLEGRSGEWNPLGIERA